jgi:hypothetical protein
MDGELLSSALCSRAYPAPSDRCSTALNAVRLDLDRTERAGSHQDRRCPITAGLHPRREKIDGIQDV